MSATVTVDREEYSITLEDGRTLWYAGYGPTDGQPVLVLHGTPGSRVLASTLAATAVEAGLHLLAPERPGYGQSEPNPGRVPTDTAADLCAVLDDAGVDSAAVVAFSGGARYALALAAEQPGRVDTIDLVSGSVPPACAESTPRPVRLLSALANRTPRLFGALARGQRWLADRGSPDTVVSLYTTDGADPVPERVAAIAQADFVAALASTPQGFRTESRLATEPFRFDLSAVSAPVTLWHGLQDENVPPDGVQTLADRLPDATLRLFDTTDHLGTLARCREPLVAESLRPSSPR